ncbi:MAG: GNAT family N-acetyltransferase [Eggerthellaceae bacterium]|nr:GNAT family N-acetyltransferase [Eggerthellaceae bacterium]
MIAKDHVFASERLRYRGIARSDADRIVAWRSRPENYRTFFNARPITLPEHLRWYETYLHDDTRIDFMIIDAEGNPIGTAGLSNINGKSCEVSYMIGDESSRGKGFAKEALRAMCELAFDEMGVEEVVARVLPSNHASMGVARGAGFLEAERVFRLESSSRFGRDGQA